MTNDIKTNNRTLDENSIDCQVMCTICNKQSNDSRCLPCRHTFCGQCIKQWIDKNQASCSTCSQSTGINNLLEVDCAMIEKVDDLPLKHYEGKLHGHTFDDSINIASSELDRHSASLFDPLRSILCEFIIQNRQFKEQIKQLEKQSQLQYQNLTEKFNVQTKKNEELQLEIAQLKKQSIEHKHRLNRLETNDENHTTKLLEIDQLKKQSAEHKTRLDQLETNDQNHNTKLLEIDQRHSSLERNLKSVERRVVKLAGECLILFCFGER
jgi:6-pyruvoyl-tetrahydropterin synthase